MEQGKNSPWELRGVWYRPSCTCRWWNHPRHPFQLRQGRCLGSCHLDIPPPNRLCWNRRRKSHPSSSLPRPRFPTGHRCFFHNTPWLSCPRKTPPCHHCPASLSPNRRHHRLTNHSSSHPTPVSVCQAKTGYHLNCHWMMCRLQCSP